MSREVTSLRKAGRLEEAYQLAMRERQDEPSPWAETALFWVLYDMAKRYLQDYSNPQSKAEARACMDRMQNLIPTMADDDGMGERCLNWLRKNLIANYHELKKLSEDSKTNPCETYEKAKVLCGANGETIDQQLHEDFGWIIYRYMRARLEELTSLEVRGLLRDYMMLNNPRPSMLHSTILRFAVKFARTHHDFVFPKFLNLWGMNNFTDEDMRNSCKDGREIASLFERVCCTLTLYPERLVEELAKATKKTERIIADIQSKAIFWQLREFQKDNNEKAFWECVKGYVSDYMKYPGTYWHNEILSLITRSVNDNARHTFLDIVDIMSPYTIKDEDFNPQKGSDEKEYPAPIVQFVRKCYGFAKNDSSVRGHGHLLMFLLESYSILEENNVDDERTRREHAKVLLWSNKGDDALPIYRNLLKTQGEKYYIWQETGECIDDCTLRAGFYLRALELEKTEDIIGPLRLKTAITLSEFGLADKARILLDAYALNRRRQGKELPEEWRKAEQIVSSATKATSHWNLHELIDKAMDFAYSDCEPKEYVLVDKFKLEGKPMMVFADKDGAFVTLQKRFPRISKKEAGSVVIVRGRGRLEYIRDTTSPNQSPERKNFTPLMIKPCDAPKWGALPEDVGYIFYANIEKKAYTVITPDSSETYFHDINRSFKEGDFIRFHRYTRQRGDKDCIVIANPQPCRREDALPRFQSKVVAVDGVNSEKSLFHIVLGKNLVSGIVRYNETSLRPSIGDLLNLTYCIRKDKHGEKRIVVLDITETQEGTTSELLQVDEGEMRTNYNAKGNVFGFVGDTYIPAELIETSDVDDGDMVYIKSVMTPEGKWKAFSLEVSQEQDDCRGESSNL